MVKQDPTVMCCKTKWSGKNAFHFHRKWWNLWWKWNKNTIYIWKWSKCIWIGRCLISRQSGLFVLPVLCCDIIILTNQFEREIHVINRDTTSKVFICSCYMIGCKSTPLLSCLKQLIPIANTHDGALPVSLWPPWVTPLLKREEVSVYWGHGAGFTGLWLVECNADEDFIQSAVFMMGELREWPLLSPDLSTP